MPDDHRRVPKAYAVLRERSEPETEADRAE